MKKISLVLVLICFATIVVAQNKTVRDHTKLQNEVSFEARMKSNKGFSLESAKAGLQQAKDKKRQEKKKKKELAKIEAIREKTLTIKNNDY